MSLKVNQKIWLLIGAACLFSLGASAFLLFRLQMISARYDALLDSQVRFQKNARIMQVTFKKEVQEWKDTLLRGSDPAMLVKYSSAFHEMQATVRSQADALIATTADPALQAIARDFKEKHEQMATRYANALSAFQSAAGQNAHDVDVMVKGQDRAPTALIDSLVQKSEEQTNLALAATHTSTLR